MKELLHLSVPVGPEGARRDPVIARFLSYLAGQMNHAVADHATAAYVLIGRALAKSRDRETGRVEMVTTYTYARQARRAFKRYVDERKDVEAPLGPWLTGFYSLLDEGIRASEQEARSDGDRSTTPSVPAGTRTVREHHGVSGRG